MQIHAKELTASVCSKYRPIPRCLKENLAGKMELAAAEIPQSSGI
jgi:hypothetical protein